METNLFASFSELLSGLFVGIVFGFLLRKAYVSRFDIIVGQLLMKDFTVMKVMMTAVAVGSAGVYFLLATTPYALLNISATTIFSALLGGGIFGIGMAIMGYCPGTGIAALADGAKDMWYGLLGMIVGAGIYAEAFPWIQTTIKPANEVVKTTLPEYFGISPWVFIGGMLFALIAIGFAKGLKCSRSCKNT